MRTSRLSLIPVVKTAERTEDTKTEHPKEVTSFGNSGKDGLAPSVCLVPLSVKVFTPCGSFWNADGADGRGSNRDCGNRCFFYPRNPRFRWLRLGPYASS